MSTQPMTPNQFMERFDFYVDQYQQEFFLRGCRELLTEVRSYSITTNAQQIEQILTQNLIQVRNNGTPPDLEMFRQKLLSVL